MTKSQEVVVKHVSFRPLMMMALAALVACAGPAARAPADVHTGHHGGAAPAAVVDPSVGFLVAAPDRGFLGNEEVEDAVAALAATRNAAALFVSEDHTGDELHGAVTQLIERGAKRVVVLPLFLSAGEARFQILERTLAEHGGMVSSIAMGQRLGDSYFAVELLAARLRALDGAAGRRVVIAGHGAGDAEGAARLTADVQRIADHAAAGLGLESVKVVVWRTDGGGHRDAAAEQAFAGALRGGPRPAVIPFQLGPKLDTMMSFTSMLGSHLHGLAELGPDLTPDPLIGLWMEREARRHVALAAEDIGVVFLAHGADHHWNQGMRAAAAKLAASHKVEFSFSMADQPLVERAIRKLEARGARAIVVVRVFGQASSFRGSIDRMLGLDIERGDAPSSGHDHGHGHGHGPMGPPGPRIHSAALLATVGGLEDSAHFAAALLDRAQALSKDPGRETVILVAHGDGDDAANQRWRDLLASLAKQMRAAGGNRFRAIETGTWREDWPAQREPEVKAIRALVTAAGADGGRAIVIPARTTGQGSEAEFLDGLTYELGTGFAPHPRFEAWLAEQVELGIKQLGSPSAAPAPPPAGGHHHHH